MEESVHQPLHAGSSESPSDEELVAALGAGGRAAASAHSALHERYAPKFLAYLLGQRLSRADAQDLVQEVFTRLWRLQRLPQISSASGYLWRMLRNAAHDLRERGKRAFESLDENADNPIDARAPATEEDAPAVELEDCLSRALTLFGEEHPQRAEVIRLAIWNSWSIREIAAYVERTEKATKQYLFECRKKLREFATRHCHEQLEAS
jgi:RNA polymerase sigma-70 factor (ECF subfamily)